MKINKFFLKVFVSALIIFSFSTSGSVVWAMSSVNNDNEFYEVKEDTISNLALELARSIKPGLNVTVSGVTKLFDKNESAIGYVVSYSLGERSYGYAVYDFRVPGYLLEFSIDENVGDVIDKTIEIAESKNVEVDSNTENKEVKIIEVEPFKYSVAVNDDVTVTTDSEVLSTDTEIVEMENKSEDVTVINPEFVTDSELDELSSTSSKYDTHDKVMLRTVANGLTDMKFNCWRQFIPSIESDVERQTGIWACAVTAMDILAKGTSLELNTRVAYPKLWNYSKTTQYKVQNGIKYGSTANGNIGIGFTQFAKEKNRIITHQNISSPSFAQFKSAIDNKKPAILGYGITMNNARSGHAVAVEGYLSSKQANYLVVADGWFEAAKYINYIPGNFTDTYGIIWSGINTM